MFAYVIWSRKTATAYVPSPLVYQGYVYSVLDNGVLNVFDVLSGERVYRARVGGGGHTFAASPWAYDDKVFFLSEEGETFVVAAGSEYREVGVNALNERRYGHDGPRHPLGLTARQRGASTGYG